MTKYLIQHDKVINLVQRDKNLTQRHNIERDKTAIWSSMTGHQFGPA
jgi:hypothetical protein